MIGIDTEGPVKPRRILVTGITSIHGWPLLGALEERYGKDAVIGIRPPAAERPAGPRYRAHCMTDEAALRALATSFRPDCVVHAGGVCDLNVCEVRPRWAEAMNVKSARLVRKVFAESSYVVYLSTDLVFSGLQPPPDGYREDDPPDPVSVVGRTYLAAENEIRRAPRHLVLRLGLPMGPSVQGSKGAVDWIASRLRRQLPVTLFRDEWRSVINTSELSRLVVAAVERAADGLYHLGGPDAVSLAEIGQQVVAGGAYDSSLLTICSRLDERDGPPRIGNVHLSSARLEAVLETRIAPCRWDLAVAAPR